MRSLSQAATLSASQAHSVACSNLPTAPAAFSHVVPLVGAIAISASVGYGVGAGYSSAERGRSPETDTIDRPVASQGVTRQAPGCRHSRSGQSGSYGVDIG